MASRFPSPQFQALRWHLLLSSLGVIGITLTAAGVSVYQFVTYSLSQKLDRQLMVLADAAAHSLPTILQDSAVIEDDGDQAIDNDGDLDLPWQDLRQSQQSIEWFDRQGRHVGQSGRAFPDVPLSLRFQTLQAGKIRALTIPVYQPETASELQGYVRVSDVAEVIEEELERLLTGLAWGGFVALLFCGAGSWWLMRQSLRPVERSFQQLKHFTADASHELRSPLTAIKTSIEVMQSHPERVHPADQQKLAAIVSATDKMTQLLEDLLLLARTDGNFEPSLQAPIPLDDLLEDAIDSFLPQAEAKQIVLKANLSADASVQGNAAQLKRLFANLLANALHYTPAGGTVKLSSHAEQDWLLVRVEDTGIGIAPENLSLVFDRFWRADQARSRRESGSGLGLAIAQSIAHAHRGRIRISSQLGVGSCFQVELPISS